MLFDQHMNCWRLVVFLGGMLWDKATFLSHGPTPMLCTDVDKREPRLSCTLMTTGTSTLLGSKVVVMGGLAPRMMLAEATSGLDVLLTRVASMVPGINIRKPVLELLNLVTRCLPRVLRAVVHGDRDRCRLQ